MTTGTGKENDLQIKFQEDEYCFPYHYIAQYAGNDFVPYLIDAWAINYVSTIEYLLKRIGDDCLRSVIDIGCGDGRFSRELSRSFPLSSVVGIDYSCRAIGLAKAMNPDIQNLHFQTADITKDQSIGTFDGAVLMEVLEHIPVDHAGTFLSSVRRLLKDNGVLYLTVPHENKPLEYKHYQHFTVNRIEAYLAPCFSIVEVVPFERISPLRSALFRLLNNRMIMVRSERILSFFYSLYKKRLFYCATENECQRIFVKAQAIR